MVELFYAREWNFGDGTFSTDSNPTHAFPYFGDYPVRLTISNAAGNASRLEKNLNLSPSYFIAASAYEWLTPGSPTVLKLTNDGVSPGQRIPFPFAYYGTTRTQIYVGANGLAGFR